MRRASAVPTRCEENRQQVTTLAIEECVVSVVRLAYALNSEGACKVKEELLVLRQQSLRRPRAQ